MSKVTARLHPFDLDLILVERSRPSRTFSMNLHEARELADQLAMLVRTRENQLRLERELPR